MWGCVLTSLIYRRLTSSPYTTCQRDCILYCIFFSPFSEINWPQMCGFISKLCSVPVIHMSIFVPISHCFDYCSFVISFKIGKCESSHVVSLQIIFAFWDALQFHMNLIIGISISAKKAVGILIMTALILLITLCSIDTLTMSSFLTHEHRMSFCLFWSFLCQCFSFYCTNL